MVTRARLKELLHYDPDTGIWIRLVERGGQLPGSIAGQKGGRSQIRIDGVLYLASRLAFLYMRGRWPSGEVDHRDTDFTNNRWSNLRDATKAQNLWNAKPRKDSSSRIKGAQWHRATGKWRAVCSTNGKRVYLGLFDTPEKAGLAYIVASKKHHGEFARA